MRLADDDRARVPFALVGVVLLVASAAAAAALAGHDPAPDRTRADRAAARATTGANVALASAARTALRNAARNPLVDPGNTRYGRAVDSDRPFRDALALRVYARFERGLRSVDARAGGVTARAVLPRALTTTDAARAIDAVSIERVNQSVVRVTVPDVRVEVHRGGSPVSRSRRNVSATVHSPVLALHDRARRFERLLERDAVVGPGLDRRLTDLLHRVVWLRGPLQYAGAPIGNVLANRHVELATNRAVLDLQEAAFGRVDAAGSHAYDRAFARVGFTDVLAAARKVGKDRAAGILRSAGAPEAPVHVGFPVATELATRSARTLPFGVNVTADRAFVAYADGDASPSLADTLRAAFTAVGRRSVEVARLEATRRVSGTAPANWTLAGTNTETTAAVTGATAPDSGVLEAGGLLDAHGRRVVRRERTTHRYVNGSRERTVVETERTVFRVSVAVGFEASPPGPTGISPAADPVLDAPVTDVRPAVRDRIAGCATRVLVTAAGGLDAIARRAVEGEVVNRDAVLHPRVPDRVRTRAYREAARLRDRARNASERISTRELAAGEIPADALAARVRGLHEARDEYASVSARAVAAAREAYLAGVVQRLRERDVGGTLAGIGGRLDERGARRPPSGRAPGDGGGPVVAVEGSPAYLTLGRVTPAVDADVGEAYYPLAARNRNWFAVPHGDAADAVLSAVMSEPPDTVALGRAAQALRAANRTLAERSNATLRTRRDSLLDAVTGGVADAGRAYRGVLAASHVSFQPHERHAVTRFALSRWPTVAARATAVANGSAARAVARAAARVADLTPTERDRLAARLRANAPHVAGRGTVRVEPGLVRDTVSVARRVGMTVAKESLKRAGEVAAVRAGRYLGMANLGAVPAGLPLAPVPGFWYATFNAWSVDVEGSWAEFAVRASGSPLGPGNGTAYVREDETVAFDVDGDGRPERVGRNARLSFDADATVVVVVPAGPRGVGDVGGDVDEQSPGWQA